MDSVSDQWEGRFPDSRFIGHLPERLPIRTGG
jgi:hypothetical protein